MGQFMRRRYYAYPWLDGSVGLGLNAPRTIKGDRGGFQKRNLCSAHTLKPISSIVYTGHPQIPAEKQLSRYIFPTAHLTMTTTSLTPYLGEGLLNVGDFFAFESILHPVAIGSIAIAFLFIWLRLSSNRTVAPLTIWDEICSIALGSVSLYLFMSSRCLADELPDTSGNH